jgi:histidinol-phosphatase (PHP family)
MRTGRYDIVAHPELYLHGYQLFDDTAERVAHMICSCAEQTGVILEYNANGYRRARQSDARPYPRPEFWDIVEQYEIRTILSSDCHTPEQLYDDTIRKAEEDYNRWKTIRVETFETIKNNPKNG